MDDKLAIPPNDKPKTNNVLVGIIFKIMGTKKRIIMIVKLRKLVIEDISAFERCRLTLEIMEIQVKLMLLVEKYKKTMTIIAWKAF